MTAPVANWSRDNRIDKPDAESDSPASFFTPECTAALVNPVQLEAISKAVFNTKLVVEAGWAGALSS